MDSRSPMPATSSTTSSASISSLAVPKICRHDKAQEKIQLDLRTNYLTLADFDLCFQSLPELLRIKHKDCFLNLFMTIFAQTQPQYLYDFLDRGRFGQAHPTTPPWSTFLERFKPSFKSNQLDTNRFIIQRISLLLNIRPDDRDLTQGHLGIMFLFVKLYELRQANSSVQGVETDFTVLQRNYLERIYNSDLFSVAKFKRPLAVPYQISGLYPKAKVDPYYSFSDTLPALLTVPMNLPTHLTLANYDAVVKQQQLTIQQLEIQTQYMKLAFENQNILLKESIDQLNRIQLQGQVLLQLRSQIDQQRQQQSPGPQSEGAMPLSAKEIGSIKSPLGSSVSSSSSSRFFIAVPLQGQVGTIFPAAKKIALQSTLSSGTDTMGFSTKSTTAAASAASSTIETPRTLSTLPTNPQSMDSPLPSGFIPLAGLPQTGATLPQPPTSLTKVYGSRKRKQHLPSKTGTRGDQPTFDLDIPECGRGESLTVAEPYDVQTDTGTIHTTTTLSQISLLSSLDSSGTHDEMIPLSSSTASSNMSPPGSTQSSPGFTESRSIGATALPSNIFASDSGSDD